MNDFEDDLRVALQRREPPDGFAERVLVRIPQRPDRLGWLRRLTVQPLRMSWSAAAAAVLVAALGAGSWEYQRAQQRRQEAERAKAELIYALELTSAKLQATRSKIFRHKGGNL